MEYPNPPQSFKPIVQNYSTILLEYNLHCSLIARQIQENRAENLIENLNAALYLADILETTNADYLGIPREGNRFNREKIRYYNLIKRLKGNPILEAKPVLLDENCNFSQWICNITAETNWYRLFIVRLKRIMDAATKLSGVAKEYIEGMGLVNLIAIPIVSHLAYLFYLPRLIDNVFFMTLHLMPGPWMGEKELSLGLGTRLFFQVDKRYFLIGNDFSWALVGIINCFVLTGVLSPFASYLTVTLYAFDVLLAGVRAVIELYRLNRLRNFYKQQWLKATPEDRKQIEALQAELSKRMIYDSLRLGLSVFTTLGLFLGMCLTIPAIASLNPVIPLVGASFIVVFALATFICGKILSHYQPDKKVTDKLVNQSRLFAAPQRQGSHNDDATPDPALPTV